MNEERAAGRQSGMLRRVLPLFLLLVVLAAVLAGIFVPGLPLLLRDALLTAVDRAGPLAPLAFIGIYTAVAALSIPGGVFLTVAGGFLFGTWLGGLYSLSGATLGASLLFLAARSSFGDLLRRRAGPFLRRVEDGFRENGASYLLFLRLVPLFPFWLVNLVPAFFGLSLRLFVICSFFGMAPGAFVYAGVGAGAGALIESPDAHVILQPKVLLPLIALAALSLLPVLYKWRRSRQGRAMP